MGVDVRYVQITTAAFTFWIVLFDVGAYILYKCSV